jgi:hypothetical protein
MPPPQLRSELPRTPYRNCLKSPRSTDGEVLRSVQTASFGQSDARKPGEFTAKALLAPLFRQFHGEVRKTPKFSSSWPVAGRNRLLRFLVSFVSKFVRSVLEKSKRSFKMGRSPRERRRLLQRTSWNSSSRDCLKNQDGPQFGASRVAKSV